MEGLLKKLKAESAHLCNAVLISIMPSGWFIQIHVQSVYTQCGNQLKCVAQCSIQYYDKASAHAVYVSEQNFHAYVYILLFSSW